MQRLRFAALVLLSCALTACGYQLRGAHELPAQLSPLYLDRDTMSLPLYRELRATLQASGAAMAILLKVIGGLPTSIITGHDCRE